MPNKDKVRHGRTVKPADRRQDNKAERDSVVRDLHEQTLELCDADAAERLHGTAESEASDTADVECGVSGVGCVWELRCAANVG
ncbi:hypothetical protein BLNAU_23419 [Blattamonas nauphoetae]|uniref:Uncharacterized protein n=1 Tax=Blattamonas nauphoetae TaxID=2049346 RepID=A0ABQ9WQC7_9EUKA|nr:hypothetical protein BLNAU_23419 [Blattamonas nauphoetae]